MPRLGEQAALTCRLESSNCTNPPQINNSDRDVSNRHFGKLQSARSDQRQSRFGLTLLF